MRKTTAMRVLTELWVTAEGTYLFLRRARSELCIDTFSMDDVLSNDRYVFRFLHSPCIPYDGPCDAWLGKLLVEMLKEKICEVHLVLFVVSLVAGIYVEDMGSADCCKAVERSGAELRTPGHAL